MAFTISYLWGVSEYGLDWVKPEIHHWGNGRAGSSNRDGGTAMYA